MSDSGMNNYKGVNYQAWAALLLFLLRANDGGFKSMTLEDKDWEDFTLTYASGKKIICESKYRSSNLNPALLKSILTKIAAGKKVLNESDEILIICPSVSPLLENNVKYIRWSPEIKEWFKSKGFSESAIALVARVSFFKAPSAEYLYNESLSYFYNIREVGYAWMPKDEVERWLRAVLVDYIYEKSAKGEVFTRDQLAQEIDVYFRQKINLNGSYDTAQKEVKGQYEALLTDIRSKNLIALKRDMPVLSAQPQLMHIAIDVVFSQASLELKDWDILWSSLIDRQYWFRIIHELRSRIDQKNNASYVLELFTAHVNAFNNPAFDNFRTEYAIQCVGAIIEKHPDLTSKAYTFMISFLKEKRIDYHDLDEQGDRQEKVEVAKLLLTIFNYYSAKNETTITDEILSLASAQFDLIGDDGEHDLYTPYPIFEIFQNYLAANFINRFDQVKEIIVSQYVGSRYYGEDFKGWDLSGSSFSRSGSEFTISDRHFISRILKPALQQYALEDHEAAWILTSDRFVARDKDDVSREKPDFLGRTSITLLLDEFNSGAHSNEAFDILKDQMLMRKGIPAKFDLIFSEVRDRADISDEKKWKLAKAFLDEYKLPNSVFVEQIVSDLAMNGHPDALEAVQLWIKDKDYRKRQDSYSFFVGQSMFKLLDSQMGTASYDAGVSILKYYLTTDEYKKELDTYDSYDISKVISKIIEKDYPTGLAIIQDLYKSSASLTINQQSAIWHSIEQLNKENKELLSRIFTDFVKPIIIVELHSDNARIEKRFSHHYARELLVQYGEHLAKIGLMDEALSLARIFVNDSNPALVNSEDDQDGSFNYHQQIVDGKDQRTISTVRGWTAWILNAFVSIRGKDYFETTLDLTEKLLRDKNLYVRTQAIIPLMAFAQNRHSVLPQTETRFIQPGIATKIEDITFQMLRNNDNPVVLKHLEAVLHRIKTMSSDQAMLVFEKFGVTSYSPKTDDIYTLLAYFAIFRKNDFKAERLKTLFGISLYDKINDFDDKPFKELLENSIQKGDDGIRTHIGWYFWTLPRKSAANFEDIFNISYKYMGLLAEKYTREAFSRIGYFIHDNLEAKPEECLSLWKKITIKERDWLLENSSSMQRHAWWSPHHHAEFLTKARELHGDKGYLNMIEILLAYPDDFQAMIGPDMNYSVLSEIGGKRATASLDRLKVLYPQLYAKES